MPLNRLVLFCLAVCLPTLLGAQPERSREAEAMAFLERYVGTWQGRYVMTMPTGEVLAEMTTQHTYAWTEVEETSALRARTVYGRPGEEREAVGLLYFDGQSLVMELTQGSTEELYVGRLEGNDTVVWVPTRASRMLDERITETFERTATGADRLVTDSFETMAGPDGDLRLRLVGEARKVTP